MVWLAGRPCCECEAALWVQCCDAVPPLLWAELHRPESLCADRKELGSQSTELCSGKPFPQVCDLQEEECDKGAFKKKTHTHTSGRRKILVAQRES